MSRRRPKPPTGSESLALPHGDQAPQRARRPEIGISGLRGTYTQVGYRSQRIAEREGRSPSRTGAVVHERVDRLKLQYQSREFVRNNGLYRGMLARARNYIVGRGFKLVAKSNSPAWNRLVEKAWSKWWKRPEITGQFSGPRLEGMVMDELLTCGETAIIPTDRGLLQQIEAEQIIGKDWLKQGIDRDANGAPTQFWVSPYNPNSGAIMHGEATAYKPETFFYISAPERPSSNRAVPPCQAAFAMLHRINDVCDSEAIAWQMQARVALISNRASGLPVPAAVGSQSSRAAVDGDVTQNWVTELDYALIFHGSPGDTVTGMERTAPGGAFSETLTMFFRLLGLPLGLPLELILLDWTHSNYSQSRAVLEQAFTTFLWWQDLVEDLFYTRVYEWWLLGAVARGEIRGRTDQLEHDWIRPSFPWIDQLAEAQAQGEKVDRGFTTFTNVCKSLNSEREDVLDDLKRETVEAIRAAQDVEEETGVAVPWEPFAGKKAPTGKTSSPADAEEEEKGDTSNRPSGDGTDVPAEEDTKASRLKPRRRLKRRLVRS